MMGNPARAESEALRVLIVEDEMLIALELEALLEEAGHATVGMAASAGEALALAGSCAPDLALVDIHLMDGPTGIEVARALARTSSATVLFMTANAKRIPEDFAGAAGVIGKPYSRRIVRGALRFVQDHRRGRPADAAPDGMRLAPQICQVYGVAATGR